MTRTAAITWTALVAVGIACFIFGYTMGGQVIDPNPLLQEQIDHQRARAVDAEDSLLVLGEYLQTLEDENATLLQLYLAATPERNRITDEYAPVYLRIASADARALYRIGDSLLSGYRQNRDRYRALLDTGGRSLHVDTGLARLP